MATTQLFTAATTKALPGARGNEYNFAQYRMVKVGSVIYVPAHEGIYAVTWPAGSFSLLYGKAGSGATYPILPDYNRVSSIAHGLDGATNILVCGMDGFEITLAAINLDSNVLHGIAPPETGKLPNSLAAY